MNSLAVIVGYIVIGMVVLLGVAIAVGRFFARKADAELEDWDPAPRNLAAPHVPPQWQPTEDHLRDLNSRDTSPSPNDPAS